MKVVLLKGRSKYDALRCYVDELAGAFAVRGIDTAIIDVQDEENLKNFDRLIENERPADLVFSFNILGEYVNRDGKTLADLAGAPHVVLYVDFPFLHIERLNHVPKTTAVLTIDASHARLIRNYFGPDRFAYVGFCPVAAMGEPRPLPASADEFLASRPVPVFCAMTYFAPKQPPWRDYPEAIRDVFAEAAELALSEEWMPALEALDSRLAVRGTSLADPALRRELAFVRLLAVEINEWVRGSRRQRFFQAAATVGLPLTVYGDGFAEIVARCPNIDYRGFGDTLGTPERMGQARLVINHNSNFGEGLHDRVPTGMLAGAAVATDTSKYYRDHYVAGREIALFRWQHLEEDLAGIKTLLEDGDALFAMAGAGQQKALQQDRWQHRIDTILAAAAACRKI